MPKLSAPQSRRQAPEAETRSVEEVMLHRRLAQMRGISGQFNKLSGNLPDENYVKRINNAASANEGLRKKHRLQSLKHRAAASTLEPLAILHDLQPPPVTTQSVESLFTKSSLTMGGSMSSSFNDRFNQEQLRKSGQLNNQKAAEVAENNAKLVATLTEKCNALAERLMGVESELAEARSKEAHHGHHETHAEKAERDDIASRISASSKKTSIERIDGTMIAMREKIGQLKDVFYTSVNEEATRESCVVRIQMYMRRAVTRRRFLNMRNATLSWRLAHSQELVIVCHREIDRQRKIALKAASFKVMREMKMLQNVVNAWEKEMRQGQALRRHIREAVGTMEGIMQHRWLKQVLRSWRGVCSGPSSKKACKSRHTRRVEAARERLEQRLIEEHRAAHPDEDPTAIVSSGIITNAMVTEEMNRGLHKEMLQRRRFHCLSQHLGALRLAVRMAEDNWCEAETHHANKVLSSVFYPWTEWAFTHARGLDRKQWRGPRRYEVPYNKRRVEIWSRTRILRKIVPAWRAAAVRYGKARVLERRAINVFCQVHFSAWADEAKRLHLMRKNTIDVWKERCHSLIERPFRAWFVYSDNRRRERADGIRLVAQYRRLKTRQFLWKIMRTWRHQAVFGKVEGLYSRTELMRSLAEQKVHSKALEHHAKEFTAAIGESTQVLEEEHATVKALESQLEGREMEVANLQMALQHCEQDVVRMRGIVDSMSQHYPSLTNHLVAMQDAFGFKSRGLDDLARLRGEEEAEAAAAADLEEAEDWLAEYGEELTAARLKRADQGSSKLLPEEERLIETGLAHEECIRQQAEFAAGETTSEAQRSLPPLASAAETALEHSDAPSISGSVAAHAANVVTAQHLDGQDNSPHPSLGDGGMNGMMPLKLERRDSVRSDMMSSRSGVSRASRTSRHSSRGARRVSSLSQDRKRLTTPLKDAPPPLSEKESSALTRMQFCFNYINFREVSQFGGERLYTDYDVTISNSNGRDRDDDDDRDEDDPEDEDYDEGSSFDGKRNERARDVSADIIDGHIAANEAMRKDLVMLHGALEFIRTGNVEALSNRLKKEWKRLETDNAGGYVGRYWDNLGGAQSMVKDGARTWNDFLVACTAKLPSNRRTAQVEEKLVRRIAAAHERAELTASGLYGAKDKTSLALNPYSSRPVDDDFRPGTPEEWAHEPRSDDIALVSAVKAGERAEVSHALQMPIGIPYGNPVGLQLPSEKAVTLTAFNISTNSNHGTTLGRSSPPNNSASLSPDTPGAQTWHS